MEDRIISRSLPNNSMRDSKYEPLLHPDHNDNMSLGDANSEPKGPPSLSGGVDKNNSSCSVAAGSSLREERVEEKSKQLDGLEESTEFNKQTLDSSAEPEEDESDYEEEDVKVCDICGDAGREDLLAVCSRCSDGAEHTYCMKDMLDEVPEHDWLCEECKLTEEMGKQRLGSLGTMSTKEGSKRPGSDSGMKMDKDLSSSRSKADNTSLAKGIPIKRPADSLEIEPLMKKQYAESVLASPSTSSSGKIASMSKENSFRSSDKMNVKQTAGSVTDNSENPRSPQAIMPQALTGTFGKSNSFGTSSSKPKVRPVDEIPSKNKEGAGGSSKVVGKSMSFKGNLNRSAAPECKVKMLSPEDSHILESRGLKQAKDRSFFERKNSLKSDPSQQVGNAGKLQGRGEAKNQHPGFLGSSSFIPADDVACKDTFLSSSSRLDGSLNSLIDRTLEKSYKNSREGATVGTTSCNQRNSVADSSLTKRLKEGASEENKIKAALQAAMQKKLDMGKKNRISEKSNLVSVSNMDSFAQTPSTDKLSNLANARNFSNPGMEAALPRPSSNSCKEASLNKPFQSKLLSANHMLPSKERDLNLVSYYDELMLRGSVIPEQDFIWQGSFEVHRNGITKDQLCGFQAHLATTASDKVSEIAKKIPQNFTLVEVPRSRTWPTQFEDSGANENNVAVYFFAKDLESYQKSYKFLLEKMIKDDLALTGTIDGCELLIFSSKHLTDKSQRWNMLFFLWGVFRGKRNSSRGTNSVSICEAPVPVEISNHQSSTLVNGNCGSKGYSLDPTGLSEVASSRNHNRRLENQSEVGITTHQPTCMGDHIAEDVGAVCQQAFSKAAGDQVVHLGNDKSLEDSRPGGCENNLKNGDSCMDSFRDPLEVRLEKGGSMRGDECMDRVNYQNQVKPQIGAKYEGGGDTVMSELSQKNFLVKNRPEFPNRKCPNEQLLSSTSGEAVPAMKIGRLPLTDLNEMDVDESDVVYSDTDMVEDMDVSEDEKHTYIGGSSSLHNSQCSISREKMLSSMAFEYNTGLIEGFEPTRADSRAATSFFFSADSLNGQSTLAEPLTLRVSSSSLASRNDDRLADGLPSLELALGAENKRSTSPGLFLSPGEGDQNRPAAVADGRSRLREGDKEGGTAALSLSLAFPFSDKDRTTG